MEWEFTGTRISLWIGNQSLPESDFINSRLEPDSAPGTGISLILCINTIIIIYGGFLLLYYKYFNHAHFSEYFLLIFVFMINYNIKYKIHL